MTFDKTIHLPVSADEAFALITEPERLRRWQTVAARVDLRIGGDYRWTVTPGHHAAGTFQEIEPLPGPPDRRDLLPGRRRSGRMVGCPGPDRSPQLAEASPLSSRSRRLRAAWSA